MLKRLLPVFLLCLALPGLGFAATVFTGISFFGANASGAQDNVNIWNTLGGDIPFNLYLQQGGNFLNSGNGANARISLSLVPGTNTFTYFAEAPLISPANFGLNLFFNLNDTTPLISAKLVSGVLSANSSTTRQLGGANTPGAGTLSFTDIDGVTYTLTTFTKSTTGNVVGAYNNVPGLIPNSDITGTIVIDVQTPEPGSLGFVLVGLFAGAACGLRRRSAS